MQDQLASPFCPARRHLTRASGGSDSDGGFSSLGAQKMFRWTNRDLTMRGRRPLHPDALFGRFGVLVTGKQPAQSSSAKQKETPPVLLSGVSDRGLHDLGIVWAPRCTVNLILP